MKIEIGPYLLDVDLEATAARQSQQAENTCTCPYCTNFRHSVGTASDEVRAFFRKLNLDPAKPWDVWGIYNHNGETELYGGCYKLVGSILREQDPWESTGNGAFHIKEGYELRFDDCLFVHFEVDCRGGHREPEEGVFWMEVSWDLPWLLQRTHAGK